MRYRVGTARRSGSRSGREWNVDGRQRSVSPQLRDFSKTLQGPFRPYSRSSNALPSQRKHSDGSRTSRPQTSSLPFPPLSPTGLPPSDIEALFQAKCLDLSVDPTSRQFSRFQDYCLQHITKRRFSMADSGLSLHSARVLARIVGNNFNFAYVNLSRNLLRDEGVVLLVTLLGSCINLVHLDVSSNDVSPVGAQKTLSVLSSHKSLTSLDFSSHEGLHRNRLNLSGAESLRNYLQSSPLPTNLNVTGTALGSEGCEVLAAGLVVSKTLLSLSVGNNAITAKGVEALAKAMAVSPVKLICFAENPFGEGGCRAISGLVGGTYGRSAIEQLDLSKCDLTLSCLQHLTPGCYRASSLSLLRLDGNPLGNSAGLELFHLLLENRTIKELGLASCKLRSEAVARLAEGLARNNTLYRLNLAYNRFEDEGAIHLAAALRTNSALKCIDLSGNNIKNKGAGAFGQALIVNSRLEAVILRDNNVEDVGGKALALGSWRSRTLVHLNLEMNSVHIHFIREISRNLDRNRGFKLKTLTPSLISEIETLSTTPQAADQTLKDLETKQNDKKEAESALNSLQLRLESILEEEEAQTKQLESSLEAARKQSAARTKELWEVKEALTAEKQQGEREAERLTKGLEGLVTEVRGLEKTITRLKYTYAVRRVEAVQRLSDLKEVKSRENGVRLIALESVERLQRDIEEYGKPVAVVTPCKQRPVLPRQSLTPQPRRRRYK